MLVQRTDLRLVGDRDRTERIANGAYCTNNMFGSLLFGVGSELLIANDRTLLESRDVVYWLDGARGL